MVELCPEKPLKQKILISFIVPTLNEQSFIRKTLSDLRNLSGPIQIEVVVVDGGSQDQTVMLAEPLCDQLLSRSPGRALQMNQGASVAKGEWLLFLHADTQLPEDFTILWRDQVVSGGCDWGRFDIRLNGDQRMFRLIEKMINLRSRLTGIATGDQGIFIKRELFEQVGGFASIPLMEDIDICKRLKKTGHPLCLRSRLVTSSRYWERGGIWATIILMWKLRLLYFLGVSPQRLVQLYYRQNSDSGEML